MEVLQESLQKSSKTTHRNLLLFVLNPQNYSAANVNAKVNLPEYVKEFYLVQKLLYLTLNWIVTTKIRTCDKSLW